MSLPLDVRDPETLALTFGPLEFTNDLRVVLPEDITFDDTTLAAGTKVMLQVERNDVDERQMLVCARLGDQLRLAKAALLAEVDKARAARERRDENAADAKRMSDAVKKGKITEIAAEVLDSGLA